MKRHYHISVFFGLSKDELFWNYSGIGINGIGLLKITGIGLFFRFMVIGEIEPLWELTFFLYSVISKPG